MDIKVGAGTGGHKGGCWDQVDIKVGAGTGGHKGGCWDQVDIKVGAGNPGWELGPGVTPLSPDFS